MSLSTLDYESTKIFLKMSKREIDKKNYQIIPIKYINGKRYYTADLIKMIGLSSTKEVWEYIYELTPDDCIDVSPDYDLTRDINTEQYEFIKIIKDKEVYIKLTIRNKLICMSFHENNYISLLGGK